MDPTNSLAVFQSFLTQRQLDAQHLPPEQGIKVMVDFFSSVPADGCEAEEHDMLLYQWGTYDWGNGKYFELDITRQFIFGEESEDDEIFQLHVTFRFAPTPELAALEAGNMWCASRDELPEFVQFVSNSAALKAVGNRADGKIEIDYECAG